MPADGGGDGGSKDGSISPDGGPVDPGPPRLLHFRIEESNPTRVSFDSSKPIAATTTTGFTVSGKTISAVTINTGSKTGHYFTVASPFSYWDNATIRYEGGSDLTDEESQALYPFTLEYVSNAIPEPAASAHTYYVSTSGKDSNGGTSTSAPFGTVAKALSVATAGTTIYVQAGLYPVTGSISLPSVGTPSAPVKIVGYQNTPGDISTNYYSYSYGSAAPALDSSKMPLFDGGGGTFAIFFGGQGDDYVIYRNLQFANAGSGIRAYRSKGVVIDNCNFKEFGDGTGDGSAIELDIGDEGSVYDDSFYRVENSYALNAGMGNIVLYGNHNLVESCHTYCDNTTDAYDATGVSDYYITLRGSDNIVRNSKAERRDGVAAAASGHGIGVKSGEATTFTESFHNLFEHDYVIGCNEGLYTRNTNADHNVFKDCEIGGLGTAAGTSYGVNGNGITFQTDTKYNVAERIYVHDVKAAIFYDNNRYEVFTGADIVGNVVRNSIISDSAWAFRYGSSGTENTPTLSDNRIENCTFDNVDSFYYSESVVWTSISGNQFVNGIFNGVSSMETPNGWSFDHNAFNGSAAQGSNALSQDPSFSGFYVPGVALPGVHIDGIEYDFNGARRLDPPQMGAVEVP
ncbi:MAG: DUF1565 domain-containing protein [Myxococcales bacterium]|nr:DUF1565 domain-containing protein [Myxococcales bacterium]MCB9582611.1 DUF1565 domain-containing protein [Polyangiaceae bacterium]